MMNPDTGPENANPCSQGYDKLVGVEVTRYLLFACSGPRAFAMEDMYCSQFNPLAI
jgi:hypothetical protein